MQTSIYYTQEDRYLLNAIKEKAKRERKSTSAVILSILEEYFGKKKLGEILREIGYIDKEKLKKVLEIQRENQKGKLLGEILLHENFLNRDALQQGLVLQKPKNWN